MTPEGGKGRRGKKEGKVKSAPLQLKEKEGRADNNLLNKCQCMFTLLKEFKHFSVLICLSVCLFVCLGWRNGSAVKSSCCYCQVPGLVSSIYSLAHNHRFRPSRDFCGAVHVHTYRQNFHTRTLRTNKSEKKYFKTELCDYFPPCSFSSSNLSEHKIPMDFTDIQTLGYEITHLRFLLACFFPVSVNSSFRIQG